MAQNITLGKWEAHTIPDYTVNNIFSPDSGVLIATVNTPQNTQLLATAANGCRAVNPSNPLAVAQNIKAMYQVCKYLTEHGWNAGVTEEAQEVLSAIEKKE